MCRGGASRDCSPVESSVPLSSALLVPTVPPINMSMKVCEVFSAVEYGYWLSPKGELHAVDVDGGHEEWMLHLIGGEYPKRSNARVSPLYQVAYEKGYVRIVTVFDDVVYEGFKKDLQTHLQQFMRLVKETDPDTVYVAVVTSDFSLDGNAFAWPAQRGNLIRFIKTGKPND